MLKRKIGWGLRRWRNYTACTSSFRRPRKRKALIVSQRSLYPLRSLRLRAPWRTLMLNWFRSLPTKMWSCLTFQRLSRINGAVRALHCTISTRRSLRERQGLTPSRRQYSNRSIKSSIQNTTNPGRRRRSKRMSSLRISETPELPPLPESLPLVSRRVRALISTWIWRRVRTLMAWSNGPRTCQMMSPTTLSRPSSSSFETCVYLFIS